MSKVFGIGLGKTGTTSLAVALRLLGYETVDNPMGLGDDLSLVDGVDAATDTPVAEVFEALDRRFPGSRFVYTVRADREAWLDSVRRQWHMARLAGLHQNEQRTSLLRRVYGLQAPRFDRHLVSAGYDRHHARVLSYFNGRDDLLVLDICGGDGWDELCAFLGRPVPDAPFPRQNVGAGWQRYVRRRVRQVARTLRRRPLGRRVRKLCKRLRVMAQRGGRA